MSADAASRAVLRAEGLKRIYELPSGMFGKPRLLHAVDGVDLAVRAGRTLAVVGESGCGKSSLARLVAMIDRPSAGRLEIEGVETTAASQDALKALRSRVQIVFQDPFGSLNPRKRIHDILEEPLIINAALDKDARHAAVLGMMKRVGLRPEFAMRYPHMFSGGQRQRVAIARALMTQPALIVADEPVSALDISVRAQILNLLMDIQEDFHPAFLFISHDLAVVERVAHDVMVMYLGVVVEQGPTEAIFRRPLHPYTQALLAAAPTTERGKHRLSASLSGALPSPLDRVAGCALAGRCPRAQPRCSVEKPVLRDDHGHAVARHFPGEVQNA